jgi:hypothetical protein
MIIKKPYGFLIKHFKIIHLLLLIPTFFLLLNFNDVAKFFADYVSQGYKTFEQGVATNYITAITYIALVVMILINATIMFLMKSKKKPSFIYLFAVLYYVLLIILAIVFGSILSGVGTSQFDHTLVDFVKDLAYFVPYPSYILIIAYVMKAIGFNIKTMRIEHNLDLHVEEEDEEEVELKINSDSYATKRRIVHILRELKYYVLENKLVFTCLSVLALIGIGVAIYLQIEVYNKNYRLYESFVLQDFNVSVKESYLTNVDYQGNKIESGKYYVALKVAIQNISGRDLTISKSSFRLYVGDKYIFPSYERSRRFIDIGKPYEGTLIAPDQAADYVFVYELNKNQLKTQYQIKILNDLTVDSGNLKSKYKIINIRPTNIIQKEKLGESKIGKEIILKDTFLGNTVVNIKKIKFADNYVYQGQTCTGNNTCQSGNYTIIASPGKTLMIIEDEIKWDKETSYYKFKKANLYEDFGVLDYKYKSYLYDGEYSSDLIDVTPKICKDARVYEVSNMLTTATKIDLNIKIRNKTYTVNIKTNEK